MTVEYKLEGFKELESKLIKLQRQVGKGASRPLRTAVRKGLQPVLATAKEMVPKDTGALEKELRINVKRPTRRDRQSAYISQDDTIVGTVSVASNSKSLAVEFGTEEVSAQSFLIPSLESNAVKVLDITGRTLGKEIDKLAAKGVKQ